MKNAIKAAIAVVMLAGAAGAAGTQWNLDVFASMKGPQMAVAKWTTTLNGKQVEVKAKYCANGFGGDEKILVGQEEYIMNDRGNDSFGGYRKTEVNGKTTEDKNVQIMTDPGFLEMAIANPKQMIKEWGISNKTEFKCVKGDKALITIGDNITMKLVANCMR